MEYLKNKQRNILGISTVETDIVWRYFVRQQEMHLECQRHSTKLREDEERALHRMH